MKKYIACILIAFSLFSCLPTAAEETASVVLSVSAPDHAGVVEISMHVYNATFHGIQAAIFYKPAQLEITDETFQQMEMGQQIPIVGGSTQTQNVLSLVQAKAVPAENYFSIAAIVNLGQKIPNEYVNENRQIVADDNGITIFKLKAKKLTDAQVDIAFATEKNGGFDATNPEGVKLALGSKLIDVQAQIVYEETGESSVINIPGKDTTQQKDEQTLRKERIQGTVILQIGNYAAVVDGVLFWVDDQNKSVLPYIKQDRTMVPLRFIAENLNATVEWREQTQEILITKDDKQIVFSIGNMQYSINGQPYLLDAAPEIIEDRTFVPLRVISEAFDKSVTWMEDTQTVIITPLEKPWDAKNTIEQDFLQDALMIMSPFIRDMK